MAMSLCLNRIPQLLPQDDPPRGWSMVTDQSLGWFWASGSHEMASALPLKKHPESQWFFPKKVYIYIIINTYSMPLSYAHQKPFKSPLIQILWSPSLTKKNVLPWKTSQPCHARPVCWPLPPTVVEGNCWSSTTVKAFSHINFLGAA